MDKNSEQAKDKNEEVNSVVTGSLKERAVELEPLTKIYVAPTQRRRTLVDIFPPNDIPEFAK